MFKRSGESKLFYRARWRSLVLGIVESQSFRSCTYDRDEFIRWRSVESTGACFDCYIVVLNSCFSLEFCVLILANLRLVRVGR
jgi:hypothetical protein